jgi:hypothetical protein
MIIASAMIANAMRKQGVAIRGKLLCGLVPLNATKVKIVDTDTGMANKILNNTVIL